MRYELRSYQKQASDAAVAAFQSKSESNGILVLPTGCHAQGTEILMYDGTLRKVEDVCVGDRLMGDDATPREVLELHRGIDEMFRITPIKGEPFVVNGGHILSLYKTNEGKNYKSYFPRYDEISVYRYYYEASANYKHLHKLYKPSVLHFANEHRPVENPYLLGLYLGDGSSVAGSFGITTMRTEVADYLTDIAEKNGYNVRIQEKNGGTNKAKTYYVSTNGTRVKPNVIMKWLRGLGLCGLTAGEKFIPHSYKTASVSDRYRLLAGLIDTDTFYDPGKNTYEYCSKSKQLADDVVFLCRSLGLFAKIGKPKVVKEERYYRIQITGNLDKIPNLVAIRKGRARAQKKSVLVTGFKVEPIGRGSYYGFTLDGNHLYCDGQMFVHHNSGKSLIVADIAHRLDGPMLILQPSKEILQQNFAKLQSYGCWDADIYSASVGRKEINRITFATIGSVMNHMEDFAHFKNVMIDECHGVNSKGGMYEEFIHAVPRQVVGLTATPFRLGKGMEGMSMLKFLTRTRPRIFDKVLYCCQVSELLAKGYLAQLSYYDLTAINLEMVKTNSTGADYDEKSLKEEYERSGFYDKLTTTTLRVLKPKNGIPRKGVLVFTRFAEEADSLVEKLKMKGVRAAIVTGETPKKEREKLLEDFKSGNIKVIANVGVLTTGFDYPELDTVILGRPTKSLALYYQCVGRAIRPYKGKEGWIIDLCGTYRRFGAVSDLKIECPPGTSKWAVYSKGRQLTNVSF